MANAILYDQMINLPIKMLLHDNLVDLGLSFINGKMLAQIIQKTLSDTNHHIFKFIHIDEFIDFCSSACAGVGILDTSNHSLIKMDANHHTNLSGNILITRNEIYISERKNEKIFINNILGYVFSDGKWISYYEIWKDFIKEIFDI